MGRSVALSQRRIETLSFFSTRLPNCAAVRVEGGIAKTDITVLERKFALW
jgi:hypothetical protein